MVRAMKPLEHSTIESLKQQRLVWSASHSYSPLQGLYYLASGYAELDQALGGWPASGLVELQIERMGIGELRLLLPALAALTKGEHAHKLQVWLDAPSQLMPQGLGGAFSDQLVVLNEPKHELKLWALEQLFRSGACSAVVFWVKALKPAQAKRLQIAAKESNTLGFMLSYSSAQSVSLPISLRMELSASLNGLMLNVFKRQNAFPLAPFEVNLQQHFPELFERTTRPAIHAYQHNVLAFPNSSNS